MLDLSLTELRLIAKNRNIKGYKSQHKDKLLETLNISVKTVKEIKLLSLSLSKLKLIVKDRRIENYVNMSKNELLHAFKNSIPFENIKEIRKENRDKERY